MRFLISLGLLCWFAFPVSAQPPLESPGIKIFGSPREGRLEDYGTGPYADLVKAVLTEVGYNAPYVIVPIKRALRLLPITEESCMIPAGNLAKEAFLQYHDTLTPNDFLTSAPIDYISAHIITLAGTKPIRSPKELEGKIVGSWSGFDIRSMLPKVNFTQLKSESEVNTLRMLHSKRVDAIWGWVPDIYILSEKLEIEGLTLDPDNKLIASSTHFVCKRGPKTEAILPRLDEVINTMRADGRLKKILGKHARIIGVDVPMSWASKPLN